MQAEDEPSVASLFDKSNRRPIDWDAGRRAFLQAIGIGAGLAALGQVGGLGEAKAQGITDFDILNFALNLEYLEAEFYLQAAFGRNLDAADTTGTGNRGPTTGGNIVSFENDLVRNYAREIARDEEAHVKFLRTALGNRAVAKPSINLKNSFTAAARAAGIIGANQTYNAFSSENHFLIAAFIFEDVGVTAYKGAAPLIADKGILEAAAGLLAVEAYHAGNIRTVIYAKGVADGTGPRSLLAQAQKISDVRDAVDGATDLDQGVGNPDVANIVPTDANGLAFSRTPGQVLSIVTLGSTTGRGGFFPRGLNGAIK